jgi:hypothetical protein
VADSKISGLADGTPPMPTDLFLVARASDNKSIAGAATVAIHDREAATTDVANTTTETTIFTHSVPANELGSDRALECILFGDYLNNNATGTSLTWRIKFGGTTIYQDAVSASAISATRRPWWLQFVLAANNATNAQTLGGLFYLGTAGGATTGLGDIDTDEIESAAPIANSGIAIDSTAARTLEVTVAWSAASANASLRRFWGGLRRI